MRGTVGIASNQANATAVGNLAVRSGVLLKDVKLEAQVTVPSTGISDAGLVARVQNSATTTTPPLTRTPALTRSQSTRWWATSRRGSEPPPVEPPRGSRLRFEVVGTSVKLFFNGALLVNAVDSTLFTREPCP